MNSKVEEMTDKEPVGKISEMALYEEFNYNVDKILEHAYYGVRYPEFAPDIEKSRNIFYDIAKDEKLNEEVINPVDQRNYLIWLMCDYVFEKLGKTPLEYLLENEEESRFLSDEQIEIAELLSKSHLSLVDIISIDEEAGILTLRDLLTLRASRIFEPRLMEMTQSPVFFGLREIRRNGTAFCCGDIYVYPSQMKQRVVLALKQLVLQPLGRLSVSPSQKVKQMGMVFNHMQMAFRNVEYRLKADISEDKNEDESDVSQQPAAANMEEKGEIQEKSGESKIEKVPETPVTVCRAHYLVENYDGALKALKSQDLLIQQKDGEFSWFRNPGEKKAQKPFGIVKVTSRKISAQTEGESNLEAMKGLLSKALKGVATYMYDDLEKRRITS